MIILPRQAPDKHRENSRSDAVSFFQCGAWTMKIGNSGAVTSLVRRKAVFWSHLYIKTIILPRQARDKYYRENSKSGPFSHLPRQEEEEEGAIRSRSGGGGLGERGASDWRVRVPDLHVRRFQHLLEGLCVAHRRPRRLA